MRRRRDHARRGGKHLRASGGPRGPRRGIAVALLLACVAVIVASGLLAAGGLSRRDTTGTAADQAGASATPTQAEAPTEPSDGTDEASAAGAATAEAGGAPTTEGGSEQGVTADDGTDDASQAEGSDEGAEAGSDDEAGPSPDELAADLGIVQDLRQEFAHGDKGAAYQRYIVIHDTEVDASPEGIVDAWDSQGTGVAAHFVVGTDGSVVQCVPLDGIAHHAGFGDAGHNEAFGVEDESRDDKVGTTSIGGAYPDYGMNSYSVGIELVHVGATRAGYPEAQLEALDGLIAYIDACYGGSGAGGTIIDHKMWRTTNSDTSAEFAGYLESYRTRRTHA